MTPDEEHEFYSRPENQEPQGAPGKRAENQQVYTRRQFLTYNAIMAGTPHSLAKEAISSWAIEHPDIDLDTEKLTWSEWQQESSE